MEPNLFSILFGKHAYGMTPEEETQWAWVFLLGGFMAGVFTVLAVIPVIR